MPPSAREANRASSILGGGSPKNFILQTEPQIQEVLGLSESGHDYFLQITDARPDTGGLSGATASEAMTWGKVDPETLPDSVTCYTDSTIALPLLTAYALARHAPRPLAAALSATEPMTTKRSAAYETRLREGPADPETGKRLELSRLPFVFDRLIRTCPSGYPRVVLVVDPERARSGRTRSGGSRSCDEAGWSRSRPRPSTAWEPSPPTSKPWRGSSRPKERPAINPVIVHVAGVAQAKAMRRRLARRRRSPGAHDSGPVP